jgi:hypothetical protein
VADRVLRNTRRALRQVFYVGTTPTNADGAVTVDIIKADGSTLVDDGATTNTPPGIYEYVLAPQANLDRLRLLWRGTFAGVEQIRGTWCDIADAFYVSLSDIRALSGLSNTTSYPNEKLEEARVWFEDKAEIFCGRAFVPRFGHEVLDGSGTNTIFLDHLNVRTLLYVKVDGVAQTGLTTWDLYRSGRVVRDTGVFARGTLNVEVGFEYGLDEPDADLRGAALTAIKAKLLGDRSGIPERAVTMTTDVGGFTLALAGRDRPTGIPEVDAVLLDRRVSSGSPMPLVG